MPRKIHTERLNIAAVRGMGDAVRSHLISMDYAVSKEDRDSTLKHWNEAAQDFEVLKEAVARLIGATEVG